MGVTVSGPSATLRWGYHPAASLGPWAVTRDAEGWSLTATAIEIDHFRVSQRPLVFEAAHASGVWRWPIESLQMTGVACEARLGPKEVF